MKEIDSNSAKELITILNFLPKEYFEKIPNQEIQYLKNIKNDEYSVNIQNVEDINRNNVSRETKKYLAYIFIHYLANEEEKREYEIIMKENEKRYEKELREKYNVENIFKDRKQNGNFVQEEKALKVIDDKKLFNKILDKIKMFIKKRKNE